MLDVSTNQSKDNLFIYTTPCQKDALHHRWCASELSLYEIVK